MSLGGSISVQLRQLISPRWRAQLFEERIDCVGCKPRGRQTKCCDFQPFIANFLLGDISLAPQKALLRQLIDMRRYVLPIGLVASPEYQAWYGGRDQNQPEETRLCAFYDRELKQCGIYRNRPGECSSYYCQSSKGQQGLAQWKALSEHLFILENGLAQASLLDSGYSIEEIHGFLELIRLEKPNSAETHLKEEKYQVLWAHYLGREEELFAKCAQYAKQMKPKALYDFVGLKW